MIIAIKKMVFLVLCFLFLQFVLLRASYGYVEPTRSILSKSALDELTNPDLPKRTGFKVGDIIFPRTFDCLNLAFNPPGTKPARYNYAGDCES